MKFRLDDDEGQTVLLKLEKARHSNEMMLMGTMPDGMKFAIMAFHENGTFTRYAGIPADSGFELSMTNEHGIGQQLVEAEASRGGEVGHDDPADVPRLTATAIADIAAVFDNMPGPVVVDQPEDYDEDEDDG